ncbi:MAG TPA: histidine kinase [Streptosporangiaceae bacterium]
MRNVDGVGSASPGDGMHGGAARRAFPAPASLPRRARALGTRARPIGVLVRTVASGRTWIATANLLVSLTAGALFAAGTAIALFLSLTTAWILGLGVLVRAQTLRMTAWMASVDRWRLRRLGFTIDAPALPQPPPGASLRQRQLSWGRAGWLWRLPAYQLIRLPLAGALAFVAMSWWWLVIICLVLAAGPTRPVSLIGWQIGPVSPDAGQVLLLVLAALAGAAAWPALARALVRADAFAGRALLGPSRTGELAAEVSRLSEARALAVQSAEAERRRIERDLHDGLQPRLVSLALDLGLARSRLDRDPAGARSMVERAHSEAKQTAEDLRNLVRGIHPAVLDERGLDAALSALVASCPVRVSVDVRLASRPDPARESTAYYVVAEAVTNVTKHSSASTASVCISGDGRTLRVLVEDDGRGGARLEPGGGLTGLAARVASLDGTLTCTSPPGGPTRIEAVIPCAP